MENNVELKLFLTEPLKLLLLNLKENKSKQESLK